MFRLYIKEWGTYLLHILVTNSVVVDPKGRAVWVCGR